MEVVKPLLNNKSLFSASIINSKVLVFVSATGGISASVLYCEYVEAGNICECACLYLANTLMRGTSAGNIKEIITNSKNAPNR